MAGHAATLLQPGRDRPPGTDHDTLGKGYYDWVLLSGTFNLGVSEADLWSTLRDCLMLCRHGIAFNLLRKGWGADGEELDDEEEDQDKGYEQPQGGGAQGDGAEWESGYCSYDPAVIAEGVERLLVELGAAVGGVRGGGDARVEVVLGDAYGVPQDFTVRVVL